MHIRGPWNSASLPHVAILNLLLSTINLAVFIGYLKWRAEFGFLGL